MCRNEKSGFAKGDKMSGNAASKKKRTWITIVVIFAVAIIVAGAVFAADKITRDKQDDNITQPETTKTTPPPTQEEIDRSKELEEEIKNDFKDKTPDDFQPTITNKQNELNTVKQETESLKNVGASEEEIAKAEEKQQEIEKQLEEVKEEQAYWTATAVIKNLYAKTLSNSNEYPNSYIRKVNRIGDGGVRMFVDAEVVSKDGNGILRSHDVAIYIAGLTSKNISTAQGMAEFFEECNGMEIKFEFDNSISDFEQTFFDNYYMISNYCSENSRLLAARTTYDENGKLSSVSLKVRDDGNKLVEYHSFNLKTLGKNNTNDEIYQQFLNLEVKRRSLFGLGNGTSFDLDYDWQNATIKYKGQAPE